MDILQSLSSLACQSEKEYHAFYREIGLTHQQAFRQDEYDKQQALSIPPEIASSAEFGSFALNNLELIRQSFLDVLLSPDSADILWHLYCTPAESSTALGILSPSLGQIESIVRGGPNIYKLSGWVVHVLVGYGIVTKSIPEGVPPTAMGWSAEITNFFKNKLQPMYHSLDDAAKTVLHVAMLGHDIGVSKHILNHHIHGVPLVPAYLDELAIKKSLGQRHPELSFADFEWAVKAVVEFHAFLSNIGREYNLQYSKEYVDPLLESSQQSEWRVAFANNDFADMLLMITVGDVIAVNDNLFSVRKKQELTESYELLKRLLNGSYNQIDRESGGYDRFKAFLGDHVQNEEKAALDQFIQSYGFDNNEVWQRIYDIRKFDFAISLIGHFPNALDALLFLLLILYFIDSFLNIDHSAFNTIIVQFDPQIDPEIILPELEKIRTIGGFQHLHFMVIPDGWQLGQIKLTATYDGKLHDLKVSK